jgi:Rrf2 family protein
MPLFSTRVRYALRMILEVHRSSREGRPISVATIAARTDISAGYLEGLVRPLKSAGLLRGRMGAGGGYELARNAAEITLCDIVEAAIGPIGVSECVVDPEHCTRSEFCECRLVFRLVSMQLRATLGAITLSDMSDVRVLDRVRRQLFTLGTRESVGGGMEGTGAVSADVAGAAPSRP